MEDTILSDSGESIPPSGDLCCEFIILIVTLQPQYNSIGERKSLQNKTEKTNLALTTTQSPRKSDFTVCQSQNPLTCC